MHNVVLFDKCVQGDQIKEGEMEDMKPVIGEKRTQRFVEVACRKETSRKT